MSNLAKFINIQMIILQALTALDCDPDFKGDLKLAEAMRKLLEELDYQIAKKRPNWPHTETLRM